MKIIKIKEIETSCDSDGKVTMLIVHMDNKPKEEIVLGKVLFASTSNKKISSQLSVEEKKIIEKQVRDMCQEYLTANNMKTQKQLKAEADQFIKDIVSGKRKPDFIGYF